MKHQQVIPHHLLYSVAPEDLPTLHLNDEGKRKGFDWLSDKRQTVDGAFAQRALNFLRAIFAGR